MPTKKKARNLPGQAEIVDGVDLEFIGSKDEKAETRSVTSRTRLRSQVEEDIARFLQQGGAISQIAPDVTADPPRKPESNYGSRAI
jgi:hypothetical protein